MSAAQAWIDGGARGNPGDAGYGVRFEGPDGSEEICGFLGRTTNNVAEYAGAIAALSYARHRGVRELEVFSDSQLLVRQVLGEYRVKSANLVPLFLQLLELRRQFDDFRIQHIPREQNRDADRLANQAIDQRTPNPEWMQLASESIDAGD